MKKDDFLKKDGSVSTSRLSNTANRIHKEKIAENFKLSALQRYINEVFDGKETNEALSILFDELKPAKNELRFDVVLKHGTKRELNKCNKAGEIVSKREYFSVKIFCDCFRRMKSIETEKSKIESIKIDRTEKKPTAKAKKPTTNNKVKNVA